MLFRKPSSGVRLLKPKLWKKPPEAQHFAAAAEARSLEEARLRMEAEKQRQEAAAAAQERALEEARLRAEAGYEQRLRNSVRSYIGCKQRPRSNVCSC